MPATVIPTRFQLRRDTAANWTAKNPTPLAGEPCLETDTNLRKLGDGATAWNALLYQLSGAAYDFANLADGDTPIWDDTNKRWTHGPGGKVYQAGSGIAIANPTTATPTISSTLGSIGLSGRVATYSALPTGLGTGDSGNAYLCDADGLIYVWNGTAFPASGAGVVVQPPKIDPYASSVVSLLQAQTSGPVDAVAARSWTNTGVTVVTKFGGPCMAFSGSAKIVSDTSTDFGFGTGDYTIEALVANTGSGAQPLFDTRGGGQGIGLYANDAGGSNNRAAVVNNSTEIIWSRGATMIGCPTLQHLALCRMGGVLTLYTDGQVYGYVTDSRTLASSTQTYVGANYASGQFFSGNLRAIRITKGVARYFAPFQPLSSFLPLA